MAKKQTKRATVEFPKQRAVDSMLHRALYTCLKEEGANPADLVKVGVRSKNTTYRVFNFDSDMSMVGASKFLEHFGCRIINRHGQDITSHPHHTTGDRAESRPRKKKARAAA